MLEGITWLDMVNTIFAIFTFLVACRIERRQHRKLNRIEHKEDQIMENGT